MSRAVSDRAGPASVRRRSSLTPRPRKTISANTQRRKSVGATLGSTTPAMDKNSMMVMEANEISAYLHKDYVSTLLKYFLEFLVF